jgi:hypothetical protein
MANMFIDPTVRKSLLRNLTHDDFRQLGEGHVAYVRPILMMGQKHYAIHDADGSPVAVATTLDKAEHMALEKDLELITVH